MTAPKAARLVVDVADLDRAAAFWAAFLDLAVLDRGVDWVDLGPLGECALVLSFQLAPRGAGKNHAHLDLGVDGCDGGAAGAGGRARALGALPVSEMSGPGGASWQVWRDPEGNEFCLCAESVAMAPESAR
jgi:catechol 2,3-dioxygenase-like lactoylglutathione lyase family enzyme